MCKEGKIEDGYWDQSKGTTRAIELNNSKRAVCCEPGIMPIGFSHFAAVIQAVVKVQEQIKVK